MMAHEDDALLKRCPFCHERNAIICATRYEPEDREAFAVSCRTRDCHGVIFILGHGLFSTREQAIEAWNTRPLGTREEVARIIDPDAWLLYDNANGLTKMKGPISLWRVEPSLAKADAVLAALSPIQDRGPA